MEVTELLEAGLRELNLVAEPRLIQQLETYQKLLLRWNLKTNLTAIREPAKIVSHHLLDALAVHEYIVGRRVLDVGSGAGLPGIPLALIRPDTDFILLDSNGKKTRFMTQAMIELGLTNVRVVKSRIENYDGQVDHVISRAFSSLDDLSGSCLRLLDEKGSLLAMKGPGYETELTALGGRPTRVHQVSVPGLDAARYLIEIPAS